MMPAMPRQPRRAWAIEAPRLEDDLGPLEGGLDDGDRLEDVAWTGDGPVGGARDLDIRGSRLSGLRMPGVDLEGLRMLDVVVDGCDLAGLRLVDGRAERVEIRDCRLSSLDASDLRGRHVRFVGCKLDDAWLRMARFERCELLDCDLSGADLYGAQLSQCRLVDCRLDGCDFTAATCDQVALHGSSLERLRGVDALRGCVIGSDQILMVALPALAAIGISVDDGYLDDLESPGARGAP